MVSLIFKEFQGRLTSTNIIPLRYPGEAQNIGIILKPFKRNDQEFCPLVMRYLYFSYSSQILKWHKNLTVSRDNQLKSLETISIRDKWL